MWVPGPLTPGTRFLFRLLWVHALSTWEQMYSVFHVRVVQPFSFGFQSAQDLISLIATMMAMITMSTTRMMRR